jgi:hypothetical protein
MFSSSYYETKTNSTSVNVFVLLPPAECEQPAIPALGCHRSADVHGCFLALATVVNNRERSIFQCTRLWLFSRCYSCCIIVDRPGEIICWICYRNNWFVACHIFLHLLYIFSFYFGINMHISSDKKLGSTLRVSLTKILNKIISYNIRLIIKQTPTMVISFKKMLNDYKTQHFQC